MISTAEFRKGLRIELDGEPYTILEFQHVKPGKGGAFVRTKLKNLITGYVQDRTFRSGEKVEKPDLEEKRMQYLYREGELYHFMDLESYEQIALNKEQLGDSADFLAENISVDALFHRGKAIGIELPIFVELEVAETEPGVRGDTASGGNKPARTVTGAVVSVPLFVNVGDMIKVDTRTGTYIERVK